MPYIALVFFYVQRKSGIKGDSSGPQSRFQIAANVAFMLSVILFLAFGEEYLWDLFLYQERGALFESLFSYPIHVLRSPGAQALALAVLSVPQVTHYVLDGFIWKNNEKNPYLRQVLTIS